MNVKTDTKEKFTVVTPNEAEIPANMTEELKTLLLDFLHKKIPHIILNLKNVNRTAIQLPVQLVQVQEQFRNKSCSFVVCELTKNVKDIFDQADAFDILNLTLTESEAWDIVQMEEIERDLLNDME